MSLFSLKPLIRILTACLGTLFSPTWPLLHWIVDPYLNLNAILAKGVTCQAFSLMQVQLHAIPTVTLVTYLVPALIGCLMVNMGFVFLCGRLGALVARYFAKQSQATA